MLETFHFIVTTNPPRLKSLCRQNADLDDHMRDAEALDTTFEDMFAPIGAWAMIMEMMVDPGPAYSTRNLDAS